MSGEGLASTRRVLGRGEHARDGERVVIEQCLGWRVEHVFDVTQTSGQPLPEPPRPQPLTGHAPDGLIAELTRVAVVRGFVVRQAPDATSLGGADGVTHFDDRTITLRGGLSDAAVATTLAHELGHVLLHDSQRDGAGAATHRGIGEVEAESVAYIVSAAHGLDTSDESLPYVATWAGTRTPAAVVQATAQRVIATAHELLTDLNTVQHGDGAPPGLAAVIAKRETERAPVPAGVSPAVPVGM